jgi:hypothetical protein
MQITMSVVDTLHAIARESEAVAAAVQALAHSGKAEKSLAHTLATCQLSDSCHILALRIGRLQQLVAGFDRDIAGPDFGSVAELGVRAQTLAILLLLDDLHMAIRSDTATFRRLFTGRLRTIGDVVSFLFDALAGISRRWMQHRVKTPGSGLAPSAKRDYRAALRRAQCEIAALGTDRDFAHFLRVGSRMADCPAVKSSCDQLDAVLAVRLIIEPDPALLLAAVTLRPEELLDLGNGVSANAMEGKS